jgi:hypothetical protein
MLLLADRITAVQVAVAALPSSTVSSTNSTSSSGSAHTDCSAGEAPAASLTQQQQQQQRLDGAAAGASAGGADGGADNEAQRSIQYIVTVLTRPLHESHQQQLQLVTALASAVRQVLLEPGATATAHLKDILWQLECERGRSTNLIAQLRKQLHHDVMHVHPQHTPQHDTHPAHLDQQQQQQQQQQGHGHSMHIEPAGSGVDGIGNSNHHHQQQQQQHKAELLVRSVSVAMSSDGVLPVIGGGGSNSSVAQASDVAVHVSRWWWVHAGEHYCQLLAFQYAFDSVVVGVLAAAHTALQL